MPHELWLAGGWATSGGALVRQTPATVLSQTILGVVPHPELRCLTVNSVLPGETANQVDDRETRPNQDEGYFGIMAPTRHAVPVGCCAVVAVYAIRTGSGRAV
jgi:hypothetical protein